MPSAFRAYTVALAVAAVASVAALASLAPRHLHDGPSLVVFALLVLAGELLPVSVPRGEGFEEVTVSAPFALAAMALFGPLAAVAMYGVSCLAVDLFKRTRIASAAFNLSQSVLALASATAAYDSLGGGLAPLLGAAVVFFAVDNVLADFGGALLAARPTWSYARDDLPFHVWTGGILLVLAPVAVACEGAALWLVPVLFAPVMAIYLGAQQAVANTHLALHDPLTGLPNRGHLLRKLDDWIAAGGGVTPIVGGVGDPAPLPQTPRPG